MSENGNGAALHALLAVRNDRLQRKNEIVAETKKVLAGKHFFNGHLKTYEHFEDQGDKTSQPEDKSHLEWTVGEKLLWGFGEVAQALDLDFQIDATNQEASATLECEGLKIENVPTTFLLDLEAYLSQFRSMCEGCQVLDPKVEWEQAPDMGEGVWRSKHPEIAYRTAKVRKSNILVEATEHHPAQIDQWNEEERVGKYVTKRWSGAVTAHQKSELLKAIDKLLVATKKALSQGNRIEHSKKKIADTITSWIISQSGIETGGVAKDKS
jgi:hypothetical protein